MAQIAEEAGLGRESLYKALAAGAKPRYDTILKVVRAAGVRLSAHAVEQPQPTKTKPARRAAVTA